MTKVFRFLLTIACVSLLLHSTSVRAQSYAWCGYVLLEWVNDTPEQGDPQTDNSMALVAFAAITPAENPQTSQPDELLQHRFSLDMTKLLVEGCYKVEPTREFVIALFDYVMPQNISEIEDRLVYTMFALGGTRQDSQLQVLYYLQQHMAEWEEPQP